MLMEAPITPMVDRTRMKTSAPAIDIGTENRMISGSRKLSNSAASDRKMMIRAKPKVVAKPPDSWTYCRDSPP